MARCTSRLSALFLAAAAIALGAAAALVAPASALQRSAVCPLSDRGQVRPSDQRPGVRRTMVPRGALSLRVCRYNGVIVSGGEPKYGLLGSGLVTDQSTIRRLTNELDALRPMPGVYNCALEQGSRDVATFVYRSGPSVVVTVDTGGCGTISNGHISRIGVGPNSHVGPQITALAKPLGGGPA